MSTHKYIDRICVAIVLAALLITVLFMNGEALGITPIVDQDAENYAGTEHFTENDLNGNWDTSGATVITLTGDSATVSGQGAYAYNGDVVISNGGYYVVSGTLTDGSIIVDAYSSSKVFVMLNGVDLTCQDDACFRVDGADKVFLTLAEGTENTMVSGATFSTEALADKRSGTIHAHDDLTINGSGALTITANYKHGITGKDALTITGGTIGITAPGDAIHANDDICICNAVITVDADDDGLVVEKENGFLYVESGVLWITSGNDGIHTTGDVMIDGGEITIAAGDDGIHSDTSFSITDGTLLIENCYEGIEAVIIDIAGGDTTIYPSDDGLNANGGSGDMFAMGGGMQMGGGNFGSGNTSGNFGGGNAGGNFGGGRRGGMQMGGSTGSGSDSSQPTPPDWDSSDSSRPTPPDWDSSDSSRPTPPDMGETGSGSFTPPDMGEMGSGSFTPPDMSQMASGQMPQMNADQNQGITTDSESTETTETYIRMSGGSITIINETGMDADGFDSNGGIYISGGTIRISLANTGSNSAIDFASENGGVCEITGGTVIAAGSYSMAEQFDSSSTQCSILYTYGDGAEAGTAFALEDSDGEVLLSWDIPCSYSSINISCPEMQIGETYQVVIGENVSEVTLEETSASFGDVQSGGFGGSMNFGGMQSRGGSDRASDSRSTESAENSSDVEQPTPPDWNSAEGNSSSAERPTPPDGMGMQGSTENAEMSMDGSETAESAEETTAVVTAKSLSDYGADTWLWLAGSCCALVIGIGFAFLYRKGRL